MNDAELHRDIGRLEATQALMQVQMSDMQKKVDVMHDAIVSAKGGWRVLMAVGSAGAAIGAIVAKLMGAAGQ